jgi:phage FluMu gp28-like protein
MRPGDALAPEAFPDAPPIYAPDFRLHYKERVKRATDLFSYADGGQFKPDPWQTRYLAMEDPFFIANKSRRIGWSYITAVKGLVMALDRNAWNYTKQYVSYSLEDAMEKIHVATEFYDSIPESERTKKLISRTRTHLEFMDANGKSISRLISLPCKQPRGKGGDISLDEYAFHAKDSEIYTAAIAVISRGGSIEIGSTPFGNKGRFFEIVTDKVRYPKYKRWNVPWYFCPALCNDWELATKIASTMTTEQRIQRFGTEKLNDILASTPLEDFQQEYECSYRDELAAFYTLDMIQGCTPTGEAEIYSYRNDLDGFILAYDPDIHGSLYAGYDVGRTNDKSELTILGYDPEKETRTVWCSMSLKGVGFEEQQDMLSKMLNRLPVHRLAIDGTGLGSETGERMTKKYNKKVESCVFTMEFKEEIANALWLVMDSRSIVLPADRELHEQIHSIKKTVTAGKHGRFDCDANQKHHGDRLWSLALANYAISAGTAQAKGQFYTQYKQRLGEGKAKISNPNVILNNIAKGYRGKI